MDLSKGGIDPCGESVSMKAIFSSSSTPPSAFASTTTSGITATLHAVATPTLITTAPVITVPLKLTLNSKAKAIDPKGDVLITFRSTETKLLVSSKFLSLTSPVFKKIFSPYRRDILELLEIGFCDESLTPEALEIVSCVLHLRHECVSTNISHDTLYEIALIAYKYCLASALGPWKEVWLKKGTGGDAKGMFVRYVFGDREGFKEECRRVILQSEGYNGDDEERGKEREGEEKREKGWESNIVPKRVYELISKERISAINSLLLVAEHFRNVYYNNSVKCRVHTYWKFPILEGSALPRLTDCDAGILGSLEYHHRAIGILPVPQSPYKGISVESLALAMKALPCVVDRGSGHSECSVVKHLARLVDEVVAGVDMLDIWNFVWGQSKGDANAAREMRWENISRLKPVSLRYITRKEAMK